MKKEDVERPDQDKKSVSEEKSRIGGDYNSGVTSEDAAEKEEIEKQASLGKNQPKSQKERDEDGPVLTKENLPEATNESKGKTGSGTRQDSN
jgi:hypothetical protein